jgi:hypothetical protein
VKDIRFKDMDEQSAQNARAAIAALVADEKLDVLSQTDLQTFLWYTLPAKFVADSAEQHEIAWSLGDALRNAGLDRYAAMCRDPATHLIIDAYADSREQGFAAYRKATEASGIEPPDTDLMQWGPGMGPAEYAVRDRLSLVLEQAVVAGELAPGARGWKRVAQRIAENFLSSEGSDGRRPLEVVEAERIQRWARDARPHREALNRAVVPFVLDEPRDLTEAELRDSLAPARALLEGIGDGVTMTQAGWLPKALVVELNDRFRWYDLSGYKANSEADVIGLQVLHELLRQCRLLTPRVRRLSVSAEGKRCLADDRRLFRRLAVQVLTGDQVDMDVTRLAAGALLTGKRLTQEELEATIRPTLDETWRSPRGQEITAQEIYRGLVDWRWNAGTFGWLLNSGNWAAPQEELTPTGLVAVTTALRAIATGPRDS